MTTAAVPRRRRDVRIIGAIGIAHLFSHFYQLTLAPLFLLIKAEFGVSNVELGALISVFFIASALLQTPAGFMVDRFGARPVLIGGLALVSLTVTGYALAPNYAALVALSLIAGAGNSVFHPADYSLLNQHISPDLMGRAYSIHTIGGHLGYGLAPVVVALLGVSFGWRGAVAIVGLAGLVTAGGILAMGSSMFQGETVQETPRINKIDRATFAVLLHPVIISFFIMFVIMAMGFIGLQNFTPLALVNGMGLSLVSANGILSGFLFAAPAGVLVGGILADRCQRQELVASLSVIGSGLIILSIGLVDVPLFPAFVMAGFLFGLALPSRDMVVRSATPKGASGRVFGFVYGGLDAGSAVTPLIYGWFLDLGNPIWVFLVSGVLMLLFASFIFATSALIARVDAGEAAP
ncbi:MAG: MFS transporter [Alphaproteobacteria bacterium]